MLLEGTPALSLALKAGTLTPITKDRVRGLKTLPSAGAGRLSRPDRGQRRKTQQAAGRQGGSPSTQEANRIPLFSA